jgi:hypothetical protein
VVVGETALEGCRADVAPWHRVDLDDDVRRLPHVAGKISRFDRAEFDDGIGIPALDPSGAHHYTDLVEREVRGVEEERLADLSIQGIHGERGHGGPAARVGNGQFQLDAVGTRHQLQHLLEIIVGQRLAGRACRSHGFTPVVIGESASSTRGPRRS